MRLDLHGMDGMSARSKVQMALLTFEDNTLIMELKIITGNGTGVLQAIVEDCLSDNNYQWTKPNSGTFLISKY